MKKLLLTLLVATCFYGCTKKCGECFVVEFEANGTTIKNETPLGEFCGSDAKQQASDKAVADGISCKVCQVQCR